MKIVLFGATGLAGKHILEQALAQGHQVTAFVRDPSKLELNHSALNVVMGDVWNEAEVKAVIQDQEAVLTALSEGLVIQTEFQSKGIRIIGEAMKNTGVRRILTVCAMGILPGKDMEFINESPDYPELYLPIGLEHRKVYHYLNSSGLDWTILCPPTILDAPYSGDFLMKPESLASEIYEVNAGNLAYCMVDEATKTAHLQKRLSITNKG
jgi:putative NADH-flavin reductase